ncbi:hypothetical protein ABT403_26915 [Streptomyces sp. NPDC000075]|uniref:hypothetical protein n=1 Tax=Streptomyces TaxID=1883 RepID=UPI0031E2EA1E
MWEGGRCACAGPLGTRQAEFLYAVACTLPAPAHVRDLVRLAHHDHGQVIAEASAKVAVAADRRFCWSGSGIYGLYRHGPLPGPRNLEHVGRLVLATTGEPLTAAALEYCLKASGYRYNPASLKNALHQSAHIAPLVDGRWTHPVGDEAEHRLLREVRVVPPSRHREWPALRDALARRFRESLIKREARLRVPMRPCRPGLDWGSQPTLWS